MAAWRSVDNRVGVNHVKQILHSVFYLKLHAKLNVDDILIAGEHGRFFKNNPVLPLLERAARAKRAKAYFNSCTWVTRGL